MSDDDWIGYSGENNIPPVDHEQRVEVLWRFLNGSTKHRAGAINWTQVKCYRLLPNPSHSV